MRGEGHNIMTSKSFFIQISNLNIVLNLLIGLGAIFLLERLDPAIDKILRENALSVKASMAMQRDLVLSKEASFEEKLKYEKNFWQAFKRAQKNITLEGEARAVQKIGETAKIYWGGDSARSLDLISLVQSLADQNLNAMEQRQIKARRVSQTGAWSLGFLVVLTILMQLILRKRILNQLINPMRVLCKVICDYSKGNVLRRYHYLNCSPDIKEAGSALNKILDKKEMGHV